MTFSRGVATATSTRGEAVGILFAVEAIAPFLNGCQLVGQRFRVRYRRRREWLEVDPLDLFEIAERTTLARSAPPRPECARLAPDPVDHGRNGA